MVSKRVAGVVVGEGFRGRQVVAFVVARGWLSWSSGGWGVVLGGCAGAGVGVGAGAGARAGAGVGARAGG